MISNGTILFLGATLFDKLYRNVMDPAQTLPPGKFLIISICLNKTMNERASFTQFIISYEEILGLPPTCALMVQV